MKKCLQFTLVVCILVSSLTACNHADVSLELGLCGSYAVPGMMTADLKGGSFSCEILEQDSQGRILFVFDAISSFSEEKVTALVICQAMDDQYVYFYEDRCYLYGYSENDDTDLLKANNDWECPLDYGKISKREKKISADMFIIPDVDLKHPDVVTACQRAIGKRCVVEEVYLLDTDQNGHVLYQINALPDNETVMYLAIVNSTYRVAILEWSSDITEFSALTEFKQANGWHYGI